MSAIRTLVASLCVLLVNCGVPTDPQVDIDAVTPVDGHVRPVSLAGLAPGSTLTLTWESQGCFHHHRVRLTLTAVDSIQRSVSLVAEVLNSVMNDPVGSHGIMTSVPARPLELKEAIAIDQFITEYRSIRELGFCTTQSRLVMEERNGQVDRIETIRDQSCTTLPSKGLEPFFRMVNDVLEATYKRLHVLHSEAGGAALGGA